MDTKCECEDTQSQHQAAPPYACWNPDCACPAFSPPSREPGQAEVLEIAAQWLRTNWTPAHPSFRNWVAGSDRAHEIVLGLLADRTRYQARIEELEKERNMLATAAEAERKRANRYQTRASKAENAERQARALLEVPDDQALP